MSHSPAVYRRRRVVAIAALAAVAAVVVFAVTPLTGSDAAEPPRAGGAEAERAQATPTPEPPAELPRGGRRILPDFRVVAYYGAPQDTQLGALGIGSPAAGGAQARARRRSRTRASRGRCCRRWS